MIQSTFSIPVEKHLKLQTDDLNTFLALRAEAKKNGLQDLSLDEINEEISQARKDLNK